MYKFKLGPEKLHGKHHCKLVHNYILHDREQNKGNWIEYERCTGCGDVRQKPLFPVRSEFHPVGVR